VHKYWGVDLKEADIYSGEVLEKEWLLAKIRLPLQHLINSASGRHARKQLPIGSIGVRIGTPCQSESAAESFVSMDLGLVWKVGNQIKVCFSSPFRQSQKMSLSLKRLDVDER
jgi:hypothetical protein